MIDIQKVPVKAWVGLGAVLGVVYLISKIPTPAEVVDASVGFVSGATAERKFNDTQNAILSKHLFLSCLFGS